MIRTMSIKVNADLERVKALSRSAAAMFDLYAEWAVENKTYNKSKAHKDLYAKFRQRFPEVPSAIIQSVRDTALETVKRDKFKTLPRSQDLPAVRYDSRTMTLRGPQLTFSSIGKRQKVILEFPEYCEYLKEWDFKGGTITIRGHEVFVNLVFETESPKLQNQDAVLGIDRGLYNLCTLSNGENIKATKVREQQRKYLYLRRKLQAKGTPSAKRKLMRLSGKEKRFSKDFNHCVTKHIATLPYGVFAIEDLSGIRKNRRGKKINKWINSWPFFQFEFQLTYKAEALGKKVIKVDARYTSQKCSSCGAIDKKSRNKGSYECTSCGFTDSADLNAAKNIRQNYLSSVKRDEEQGAVNHPNVINCSRG